MGASTNFFFLETAWRYKKNGASLVAPLQPPMHTHSYYFSVLEGPDGNVTWSVLLDKTQPGGPYDITAILGRKRIQLTNIFFGDIWFCSGQSNMAYSVGAVSSISQIISQMNGYEIGSITIWHYQYSRESFW